MISKCFCSNIGVVERRRTRRRVAARARRATRAGRSAGGRAGRSVGRRRVRTDHRERGAHPAPESCAAGGNRPGTAAGFRLRPRRRLGAGRLSDPPQAGARSGRGVGLRGGFRQLYAFARSAVSAGRRGDLHCREMGGRKRQRDRCGRQPAGFGRQQRRRQHVAGGGSSGQGSRRTADPHAGADVAGDRRRI